MGKVSVYIPHKYRRRGRRDIGPMMVVSYHPRIVLLCHDVCPKCHGEGTTSHVFRWVDCPRCMGSGKDPYCYVETICEIRTLVFPPDTGLHDLLVAVPEGLSDGEEQEIQEEAAMYLATGIDPWTRS